jgi:hypothetical protein
VASGARWWTFLRRMYAIGGFRDDFDVAALHPYSPTIADLRIQVRLARRIMSANGDRDKPLGITEIGWSSGRRQAPLVVGPGRQARLLARAFRLLGEMTSWRISDAQWYAWQDSLSVEPFCGFCRRAGMFDLRDRPKRSWDAYRRVVR